jgi:hypothetical protein
MCSSAVLLEREQMGGHATVQHVPKNPVPVPEVFWTLTANDLLLVMHRGLWRHAVGVRARTNLHIADGPNLTDAWNVERAWRVIIRRDAVFTPRLIVTGRVVSILMAKAGWLAILLSSRDVNARRVTTAQVRKRRDEE